MWLLNSCTWEMKEFISHKQAPPYAILSHTWGEEEVSFREWNYEPISVVEKKEGFRKISFCCQQAASDGLEWVWIDTCCIDKSSSAELSEAINSMFQWYKTAAACYAYLSDVSGDEAFDLAKSRWVTRGWTLQELIAPQEVIFYSATWQAIGTRSKLSEHIATVTQINEPFLTGKSLEEASIAQRMSWAARRTTSREEDTAYCLLGLFNVNMPLIYGEGMKAFRRLQETLVREYPNDHSLFAWGKIANTPSNRVESAEQIWGRQPIIHDDEKVNDELYGLLAESPEDYAQSGGFVIAPTAPKYFYLGSKLPSVSSIIGRIAHVDLPQFEIGPHVAFHVDYPKVVRIIYIRHIVLLCGTWDSSKTIFNYVSIPIADTNDHTSRTGEIVLNDTYTQKNYSGSSLTSQMRKFTIRPLIMPAPRPGDLIIRRHSTAYQWSSRTLSDVSISFIDGVIRPHHKQLTGPVLCYEYGSDANRLFIIALIRLDSLAHNHDDPESSKKCGALRFGLHPVKVSQSEHPDNPPLTIIDKQGDPSSEGVREHWTPNTFRTNEKAVSYCFDSWKYLHYTRDMAAPDDEWNISILGVADIYLRIERVYLDEWDSDDDEDEGESEHRFVDVLDFIVKMDNQKPDTLEEIAAEAEKKLQGKKEEMRIEETEGEETKGEDAKEEAEGDQTKEIFTTTTPTHTATW